MYSSKPNRFEKLLAKQAAVWESALDTVYPDRADPPQNQSLPLEAYAGTYFHPGYQNLTLTLQGSAKKEPKLVAEFVDATWPTTCDVAHVSGEHWLAYCGMVPHIPQDYAGAHSEIGPNGKVEAFVLDLLGLNDGNAEGSIRFQKIA